MKYLIIGLTIITLFITCSKKSNPITNSDKNPQFGTLTDNRNGKIYKTVTIGKQIWMAENLNIGTRIYGINNPSNNGIIEKYAYNDTEAYADTFGGLYQWDEAMQYDTVEGMQGICPVGWHIPTSAEWNILLNSIGGSAVDSTVLMPGGSSGFQALLSGDREYHGLFENMGYSTTFWSSTQYTPMSSIWYFGIVQGFPFLRYDTSPHSVPKQNGFCVRCLKN